jgi:hypothetical protein
MSYNHGSFTSESFCFVLFCFEDKNTLSRCWGKKLGIYDPSLRQSDSVRLSEKICQLESCQFDCIDISGILITESLQIADLWSNSNCCNTRSNIRPE